MSSVFTPLTRCLQQLTFAFVSTILHSLLAFMAACASVWSQADEQLVLLHPLCPPPFPPRLNPFQGLGCYWSIEALP